jgi:hypothetical protein
MKTKPAREMADDLRPEYDLRQLLRKGIRGKYAKRCQEGTNVVLLEPEVARAFPTASAVNEALRLVIRLAQVSNHRRKRLANA